MWPGVADDLTRYVRTVLEQTEDYPVPEVRTAPSPRASSWCLDAAAPVRRGRRAAHAHDRGAGLRRPRARRPTTIDGEPARPPALGHAVHHAGQPVLEPGRVGAGRARPPTACPVGLQIMARRHRDEVPLRLAARSGSRPALAPPRPPSEAVPRSRQSWRSRRKRSTSSTSERPRGAVVVVGVVALLELGHVVGRLVVLLDQLGDLALVGRGRDLEVGGGHPRARAARRARSSRASVALGDGAVGT